MKNNIINLENFRKSNSSYEEDIPELDDVIIIGWAENKMGERSLHIISDVDTVPCLWMIELAQKIVEGRPPEIIRNDNE